MPAATETLSESRASPSCSPSSPSPPPAAPPEPSICTSLSHVRRTSVRSLAGNAFRSQNMARGTRSRSGEISDSGQSRSRASPAPLVAHDEQRRLVQRYLRGGNARLRRAAPLTPRTRQGTRPGARSCE